MDLNCSPLLDSQCLRAAVDQQADQALARRLPNAAVALLGGQLSGAGHWAIPRSLGRLGRRRRLPGFFGFPLAGLPLGLSDDEEAEEEEEEETAWQDTHGGWRQLER